MFEWVTSKAWEETLDWLYSQLMGFVSSLFDTMNSMSAEVFDLAWVQAIVHFCTLFGWALFVTGLVVAVFDTAIGAQSGRTDIHGTALNAIKGFFAVCLFTCLLYTSLGYRGGENRHTYPAHTAEKAAGMLEIAASLADFVLVDAGWYLTAPLAEAAVRNAATVFKVIRPGLPGIGFLNSQESLYNDPRYRLQEHQTILNVPHTGYLPVEETAQALGIKTIIPYAWEVEKQMMEGRLLHRVQAGSFNRAMGQLVEMVV